MPSSLGEGSCPLPKKWGHSQGRNSKAELSQMRVMTLEGRDIHIQSSIRLKKPASKGQSSHNQGELR